jgi:hypothetical protein
MDNTMTLGQLPTTWMHHFGKPENKAQLRTFSSEKVKGLEPLIRFYRWCISVVDGTPAWNVSGVNEKINEITDSIMAHITNAKTGKKSAHRLANDMLNTMAYHYDRPAYNNWKPHVVLKHILTDEEIQQLIESAK